LIRFRRRVWIAGAALLVLLALGALTRATWLQWPARWLVVNDRIEAADVIVVLSGNSLARAKGAAQLYRERHASRLIVNGGHHSEYFEMLTGERAYDAELIGRVLVRLGVPRESQVLVNGMSSTQDEAVAFRQYVAAHPMRKAILVTSHLHSRRARWIFRRALAGTGVEVTAFEAPQTDVSVRDWWQHPDAALGVLNEYLKFVYYVVKY
jgi:uncharacterized SAM-binding protein YcdF (DUF218 family)